MAPSITFVVFVLFVEAPLLWDSVQPSDGRGEEIEDWLIDNDLNLLNDGSPTRVNRTTENNITSDVSLCGNKWINKINWQNIDGIGVSDHIRILMDLNSEV